MSGSTANIPTVPRPVTKPFLRRYRLEDRGHETPCWIWQGARVDRGYGIVHRSRPRRMQLAHRAFYEEHRGPIPDGLTLDHLCRVHECVCPDHCEPVTARENVLRGDTIPAANAAKTHCKRGHRFTQENTYRRGRSRRCRICHNAGERARRGGMPLSE